MAALFQVGTSPPLEDARFHESEPPDTATSAASDALIAIKNVTKTYEVRGETLAALSSVSATVAPGEFVSILGPSGCGKSTLLMMLGGLERPTGGYISIAGHEVKAPRSDVSMIFQHQTLLPWKTAIQNILFPVRISGHPTRAYEARARELLAVTGLASSEHKRPAQLSGGMRQRVALCRALITNPNILLMDEPFSALDTITRDEMNMLLIDIWERNRKTALFVTHSIREAVLLSDRVLVLGGQPSSLIADVAVPFSRPRRPDLGETVEFNRLCAKLRKNVEDGRRRPPMRVGLPERQSN
jgi:NitT/TauT family transport system ATP-binding protein